MRRARVHSINIMRRLPPFFFYDRMRVPHEVRSRCIVLFVFRFSRLHRSPRAYREVMTRQYSITTGYTLRWFLGSVLWSEYEYSSQGSADGDPLCGVYLSETPAISFVLLHTHHLLYSSSSGRFSTIQFLQIQTRKRTPRPSPIQGNNHGNRAQILILSSHHEIKPSATGLPHRGIHPDHSIQMMRTEVSGTAVVS